MTFGSSSAFCHPCKASATISRGQDSAFVYLRGTEEVRTGWTSRQSLLHALGMGWARSGERGEVRVVDG